MPAMRRATFCITLFTASFQVNISWWFMPPGKNQSAAARRSSLALPTTFWVSIFSPSRAGRRHVITLCTPSTRMRQPSQRPT